MTDAQMADLKYFIEVAATIIIAVQAVVGILVLGACRRIARNEVDLGDLIRDAVDKIESDLPRR